MSAKISVGLRMEPGKVELLKRAAKDDHRTVASLLDKLVDEYLHEHGYLGAEAPAAAKGEEARPAAGRGRRAKA